MEGKQSSIWGIQELLGSLSPSATFSATSGAGAGNVDATTHASATNILATAMIKEVHLLEHKSTFKVPLGVVINCLPSHEMTASGEAFCYTVLPDSVNTVPLKLFQVCVCVCVCVCLLACPFVVNKCLLIACLRFGGAGSRGL
jgi:hypothetical protein